MVDLKALAGHTPGPWERHTRSGLIWITGGGVEVVPWSAFDDSAFPRKARNRNSKLIAAAPDLLAEVRALRAERDALRGELATVLSERDGAVSIGTQLERERDALKQVLSSSGLQQQNTELIARLEAKTEREILLSRISPEDYLDIMDDRDAFRARVAELERLVSSLIEEAPNFFRGSDRADAVLDGARKAVRG